MFPWNQTPKGNEETFKLVAKVSFYILLLTVAIFAFGMLWLFLETHFGDGSFKERAGSVLDTLLLGLKVLATTILPLLLVTALIFYISGKTILKGRYREKGAKNTCYLQILPSSDIRLEIEKVSNLAKTFGGMVRPLRLRFRLGIPWFRLRFAIPPDSQEIGIYLSYPRDKQHSVINSIKSVYPKAEIHEITEEKFPNPVKGGSGGHFIFQLGQRKGLPLTSIIQKKQSALADILNCLRPGTFLDLQFAPVSWRELEERSENAFSNLRGKKIKDMDPEEKARRVSLTQRLTGRERSFRVRLSIWSNHIQADSVVRSTANAIETVMNYDGAIRFIKHDWWNPLEDRNAVPVPIPFTMMTWDCDELANLFHIPPGDHWIYQEPPKNDPDERGYIVHLKSNQRSVHHDELQEGVVIGTLKHPLETREVRVSYEQLSKHFIVTGASGMGKSSVSVEMIQSMLDLWLQNPEEHPGFTIIDPVREFVPIIKNRLRNLEEKGACFPKEKIHYFNLSHDTSHVPGLNLLLSVQGEDPTQSAQQIATVLCTDPSQEEDVEYSMRLLNMAILSLLEDTQLHTILSVEDIFRHKIVRDRIVEVVQDPYVKRFWKNFEDRELKKDVDFVLHRIDKLLQNPTIRRLVCQTQMTLDVRRYMDEGHIVLIDTYGIKDYPLRVLVGHLLSQYYSIAKKRPPGSKFHLMMVDEAQDVQIPLLTDILTDDRKHAFGLGLVTREIDQFKNEELVHAIRSNVGMILSCGQSEGSKNVESLTRNVISADVLENLSERTAAVYIRAKRNQRADVTTCVVQNAPPILYNSDGSVANHQNEEKELALEWGLGWGTKKMESCTSVRPVSEVEKEIAESMEAVGTFL